MTETTFDVRRENLRALVLNKFGGNRAALARAAGVHQNQINLLLSPNLDIRRNLGEALARRMEGALGLVHGYFDAQHDPLGGGSTEIKAMAVPEPLLHLFRTEDIIQSSCMYNQHLTTLAGRITSPDNLVIARVNTHEMAPEIAFGDHVMLDLGAKAIGTDGVYIVQRGTDLFLRRVTKLVAGGWVVKSPNEAYESMKLDNLKGLKSVGKIVSVWKHVYL